jgi:hypothetical protein
VPTLALLAAGNFDDLPTPPSELWVPNILMEEDLTDMVVRGILPEKAISR